jgi:hypothetical protein
MLYQSISMLQSWLDSAVKNGVVARDALRGAD